MNSDKFIPRLTGVLYLIVVVVVTISMMWSNSIIGFGSISDKLINISNNFMQFRLIIIFELIAYLGVVTYAILLFIILRKYSKIIALLALGLWFGEIITAVVSLKDFFSLLPLSQEFVAAVNPDSSYFQTLGVLIFNGRNLSYAIALLFFGVGGIMYYYLFYKSKYIPRVLSVWGIAAASLVLFAGLLTILGFFNGGWHNALYVPNFLFELTIGLWLSIKGIKSY